MVIMNPNFRLPVNNSFFPPNQNYNPNICSSLPGLPQNSAPPFAPHQNSQHVFESNSHVRGHIPSFLPDLQVIKTVPPPILMTSAPPTLSNTQISEAPAWNQAPIINQRHFNDQARHPSPNNYLPPMFPPTNYNNRNQPYPDLNGFSSQPNLTKVIPSPQTSNVFHGNHVAAFSNSNSAAPAQMRHNSFPFASNGMGYNQNNGTSTCPDVRNSTIHHMNNSNPHSFNESRPMHMNSNQGSWAPGFGGFSNNAQNANEQARQNSFYAQESNCRIPHDASKNNFQNRSGNRRCNPFGSPTSYRNKKFDFKDSVPQSLNSHGNQNRKMNNGQGRQNIKTEKNCDAKPFSCDTCDRAFASEFEMRHHLSEHIKCNYGDCQFEAHPKIVALHKKMQHDTGYADVISKLKNADDIEKWRAERRRRFPTAENVRKRKAEEAEKEARGEIIENKDFGKFKRQNKQQNDSQNNDQGSARKRRRRTKNRNAPRSIEYSHSVSKVTLNVSESESGSDDDSHIKVPKFLGMNTVYSTEKEKLKMFIPELSSNCKEEVKDAAQKEVSNSALDVDSNNESPIELVPTFPTNDGIALNQISDSIDIDSDNESHVELPAEKIMDDAIDVTELMSQSIEIVEIAENRISDTVIDLDSDDESPIELPLDKNPSSISQNIETVEGPPSAIFNSIDGNSDDESPIELPIKKSSSPINQSIKIDHNVPQKTTCSAIVGVDSHESPNQHLRKESSTTNQSMEKGGKPNYRKLNKDQHDSKAKTSREWPHNKEYTLEPRKSSLLEKLLADDIRHERNAIMQCIRHVVKNNFFGIV